jgi:peptidyl-prolyl cis-trans isomerase SurA
VPDGASSTRAGRRRRAIGAAAGMALAALLVAAGAAAQERVVDRIVAVVGDRAILHSQVEEEVDLIRMQEASLGMESSSDSLLRARALEQLIGDQLVLAKADLQATQVTEEEVEEALASTLGNMRRQFGSEAAFQAQLAREGLTEDTLKKRYRDEIRNQLKGRRVIDREVNSKIDLTDEDVRRFYEEHEAEIPTLPRRLELAQIIVRVGATAGAREAAMRKIEQAQARLAAGEAFEAVATELSEGPSAARGGDLGQFRPSDMEPAFESAVRALEPGEVSAPVETRIGVHLIRLDEKGAESVRAHHILALYPAEEGARDSARVRMEEAIAALRGGADFGEIAARYSDDESTRQKGGRVGYFAIEELPQEYREVIEPLRPGDLSSVLESDEGFLIFKLAGIQDARKPTFEEVKNDIEDAARQQKAAERYAAWIEELKKEIFVRVL